MKYLQRFTAVCLLSLSVASVPVMAQSPVTAPETPKQWDARWISGAGISPADYGVYLFRKTFSLKGYSGPFTIHLTADNRYRLYVNGRLAGMGPARSDPANWYYATIDISSYLKYGDNVIAVEVVNYGPDKPRGQFTYGTGLLVQGHTDREAAIINTGTTRWQVMEDAAFYSHPLPTGNTGFYGAFPGDSLVVSHHPHGWEQPEYDAARWDTAISTGPVALQGTSAATWRLLAPQPFGALLQRRENFTRVIKEEGIDVPPAFLQGTAPVTVPAKRKVKLLLDRGYLTTGFPELLLSGGLDATVTLTYSTTTDPGSALQDVIRPDGGARRRFTPTGYRSFRYVLLDIETGKSPLTLEDYANVYTQYNLADKTTFAVDVYLIPSGKRENVSRWLVHRITCTMIFRVKCCSI